MAKRQAALNAKRQAITNMIVEAINDAERFECTSPYDVATLIKVKLEKYCKIAIQPEGREKIIHHFSRLQAGRRRREKELLAKVTEADLNVAEFASEDAVRRADAALADYQYFVRQAKENDLNQG